ncbi:LCP family protein [Paenibacillus sp. PDC88]|uniref:LCP family protein n=1 Tax=Paenibacillus sp. PDC88 TaxID=1884375 RepID=UPI000898FEEC|nr:LCP family protein [Paenibacillus sp. PDC88]SDW93532.1 transcriptional attenuator, LytR family [Paenibacillus sp. PDC88]
MRSRSRNRHRRKRRGRGLLITLLTLVVVVAVAYPFRQQIAIAAFDLFLSGTVENQLEKSYKPSGSASAEPVVYQDEPFSVLLLGTDARPYEKTRGRSDTVIYAVVRPQESRVLLVSIPRDTYVEIVGHDADEDGMNDYDKLTHAFAFGEEEMAINTVEKFLGYEVNNYATVNFMAIQQVVDAIGGVELPITEDIVNKNPNHVQFTIEGGKPIYSGEEALYYIRYREDSDFKRAERQQIFLNAVANRMLNVKQISQIPELFDIMGENFQTDLHPTSIINLAKQVLTQGNPEILSFTMMGEGVRKDDGIFYTEVDEKYYEYSKEMIANWLDPNTTEETLLKPEDFNKEDETESDVTESSENIPSQSQ